MAETKEAKTAVKFYWGTGRRKTSVARVRISIGSGKMAVNGRALDEFFTEVKDRRAVTDPIDLCEMRNKLDVHINVRGGGITGQSGAIKQGMARALKDLFGITTQAPPVEGAAPVEDTTGGIGKKLRDSGYLTRDGRMKERKKYGLKGARRAFQFSKR